MRARILYLLLFTGLSQLCLGAIAHSASIEVHKGLVLMHASVNGKSGTYLFDSGAPGLVVNASRHTSSRKEGDESLSGINGQIQTSTVSQWQFNWNGFLRKGVDAYAIDLSAIESTLQREIDGLVGMDLFSGYYVLIDYAESTLELWSAPPAEFQHHSATVLRTELIGHIPVVTLSRDGRSYRFVIDTGSGTHLVDKRTAAQWKHVARDAGIVDLIGGNQRVQRTRKIAIDNLTSQGISMHTTTHFVVTDLSEISMQAGTRIDGVLGFPIFDDRRILIDRDRSFLCILDAATSVSDALEAKR